MIHGKVDPVDRDRVIEDFRLGRSAVLVSTDLLNRGFDVPQVMCVVNYEIPVLPGGQPNAESYYHRTGRAGRFGRKAVAINMLLSEDDAKAFDTIDGQYGFNPVRIENAGDEAQLASILMPHVQHA